MDDGVAALRRGDASAARRVFESALAEVESGEAFEGLAEALYLEREYAAAADHYERAYAAYRRERQHMAAGRRHAPFRGSPATCSGTGPFGSAGSHEPAPS